MSRPTCSAHPPSTRFEHRPGDASVGLEGPRPRGNSITLVAAALSVLAALVTMATAATAAPPNWVMNGEFGTSGPAATHWQLLAGSALANVDRRGGSMSGSLRATAALGQSRVVATQCISTEALFGPVPYRLEGWVRVLTGYLSIDLATYDTTDCSGQPESVDFTEWRNTPWAPLHFDGLLTDTPRSVAVRIYATEDLGEPADGFFDDIRLQIGTLPEDGPVKGGAIDYINTPNMNELADEAFFSGIDRSGHVHSASLGYRGTSDLRFATQCVSLPLTMQGTTATLVADGWVVQGQASVEMTAFASTDCAGPGLQEAAVAFSQSNDWVRRGERLQVASSARSVRIDQWGRTDGPATPHVLIDNIQLVPRACVADDERLCLLNDRYQVTMTYELNGQSSSAHAVSLTDDAGFFQFFGPSNIEASIKMVDGCPINGKAWIYIGGMTDLPARIEIEDLVTGETFEASSSGVPGVPFPGVATVDGLPACPLQQPAL